MGGDIVEERSLIVFSQNHNKMFKQKFRVGTRYLKKKFFASISSVTRLFSQQVQRRQTKA